MDVDSRYTLSTEWRFDAPLEAVWAAIVDVPRWPLWWPGIEQVVTLAPGDARGLDARRWLRCRSVLPFRLQFTSCVTRIEPQALIEGRVEGDLQGTGCCRLAGEGGCTCVRYDWCVRTTGRWLNRLAPLAGPLFRWNHDVIMRAGGLGLARWLARETPR